MRLFPATGHGCSREGLQRGTCAEDHQKPTTMRHHVNLPPPCFNISSTKTGRCICILPMPPLVYLNPAKEWAGMKPRFIQTQQGCTKTTRCFLWCRCSALTSGSPFLLPLWCSRLLMITVAWKVKGCGMMHPFLEYPSFFIGTETGRRCRRRVWGSLLLFAWHSLSAWLLLFFFWSVFIELTCKSQFSLNARKV